MRAVGIGRKIVGVPESDDEGVMISTEMRTPHQVLPRLRRSASLARLAVLPSVACLLMGSASAQPAPQRSDELCASLKESAADHSREFKETKPGACMMNIDTGYNLFVDYGLPETLAVSLSVNPVLLSGDASAFWLRLSALDNLAHTALGTRQRTVFDELNKLAKKAAEAELVAACGTASPCDQGSAKGGLKDLMLHSKVNRVTLGARADAKSGIMILIASATVSDIEKMTRRAEPLPGGRPSAWRNILALSLQAFANGAKVYATAQNPQVRQPLYRTSQSCYTNLIGKTIITNCY